MEYFDILNKDGSKSGQIGLKGDLTLQKSEVEAVKYISRKEMIKLIRRMDYRPQEYRNIMENYVRKIH